MSPIRCLALALATVLVLTLLPPLPAPTAEAQIFAPLPQYYARGFGKNKIQYRDFDWQIYHSPHFDVYYYSEEEELLEKVVSYAESAYDSLSRFFDVQIQEPTPLIFYATHAAFEQNNIILNFIPEGVGAFATPTRFRMVLPVDLPDAELMALIRHELTHIFQYHIFFQGNLGRALASQPPTWVMEGMASYVAEDETTTDLMVLRDAVVNDNIPRMTEQNVTGFFAYRIGHAAFDYIEEEYGEEGFRDFVFEMRNTFGGRVDRAVERAFNVEPDEFDSEFRRWLRRKYLPELVRTGEPGDFGRPFRIQRGLPSQEMSPTASPSGDLVASFSSERGELDISLFDTQNRRVVRNLTKGYNNDFQYLVGQFLTIGFKMGRDIAFSPDGNLVAAFAKRERGRSLVLIDVLKGGIEDVIDMPSVDQQLSPAWHPDGRRIAFQANRDGRFDIFVYHLDTGELENVTDDEVYDGAPTFSPDGESLIMTSVVGEGYGKLFRVDLDNPRQRFQVTFGESNEKDAVYSPTGRRLYFTSDRDGADNIYGLDMADGRLHQYTNAVTGCFQPTVVPLPDGKERLVYTGYWKGRFDLYRTDVDEPSEFLPEPRTVPEPEYEPSLAGELPTFEPDIRVAVDDANKEPYSGFKLFLENADSFIGIDDDQTLIGRVVVSFSDYLGDQRVIGSFSSVDSFSNFDVFYLNLKNRLQWQVHLFDDRDYFLQRDLDTFADPFDTERGQEAFQLTGAIGSLIYPLSFHVRGEVGLGYAYRQVTQPILTGNTGGRLNFRFVEFEDDFPVVTAALVGDSALLASYGPVSGRRWRLDLNWAPDLDNGGSLSTSVDLDVRQYIPITRRSQLALRGFAAASEGNVRNPTFFGGLDTVRGYRFRSFVGDRGFFANAELRFPLIDLLATPIIGFQGIRGVLFVDVGGAWYDEFEDFDVWDSEENRLEDARGAYGYGITVRFGFLDLNLDFAKRTDFQDSESGFESTLWIGSRF